MSERLWGILVDSFPKLLGYGVRVTIPLTALSFALALLIAVIVALIQYANVNILRQICRFYIWIVRGTPLMLQLLVVYYGPGLLFGQNIWGGGTSGRWIAAVSAFVLNYACYFSEIYRGGIEAIPKGQWEAGQVLGLRKGQIFFHIILLQVIKRILAPISNEVITLVKDTSLARVILVYEIIWESQSFIRSDGLIWPLFFTGLYYLAFTGLLTLLFGYLEKKLKYFRV